MALVGDRIFVGFGFGAIQAGLFLYEAFRSEAFRRLVVAEVMPEIVAALRRASGLFSVNIAHPHRVERASIGPIEAEDPAEPVSRSRLAAAVEQAAEISTAVPSVDHYRSEGPGSIHRILAEGLARKARSGGCPAVVYAAENHNRAAEILREAVLEEVPADLRDGVDGKVAFLNTVIGKMSGVVTDPEEVRARGLTPMTRRAGRAFLVESFNRILISEVKFGSCKSPPPSFRRGISVFVEKPDLLPFEEAKLYGHNATHAAAAYIATLAGLQRIAEVRGSPGIMDFLRAAFVEESGGALLKRHGGIDPLFTPDGYGAYADDLLARMTNPHLGDTAERVGRDVRRKLGWDDRLIGTIRVCHSEGIVPRRYAIAAGAALAAHDRSLLDPEKPAEPVLREIWGRESLGPEAERVIREVEGGRKILDVWARARFPDLERLVREGDFSRTMK